MNNVQGKGMKVVVERDFEIAATIRFGGISSCSYLEFTNVWMHSRLQYPDRLRSSPD